MPTSLRPGIKTTALAANQVGSRGGSTAGQTQASGGGSIVRKDSLEQLNKGVEHYQEPKFAPEVVALLEQGQRIQ